MDKNQSNVDKLRPQEADGIQEYDNDLPTWWISLFYFTIIFSVLYMLVLHIFPVVDTLDQEFDKNIGSVMASGSSSDSGPGVMAMLNDPSSLAAGKEAYINNCAPCHREDGGGLVGPNLTDEYWVYGGDADSIEKVIINGVPDKGMIGWLPILGARTIKQTTAYVLSLKGTNPPDAKEPEGERVGE
jgi:cytochrome c oxidase cbb3-type subunit III